MATPAEVQAVLGDSATIMRSSHASATLEEYYVLGGAGGILGRASTAGRHRWMQINAAQSAAVQATAIMAALNEG